MIFNQTKWRYPLILAALSVILGFGFLGYRYMQSSPQKITQYEGVTLGESKDKVELALGVPTAVSFPPKKENLILEDKTILRDVEITRMALKKEIETLGNPAFIESLGPTRILQYLNLNMLISIDKDSIFHIQVKNITKS